FLAVATTISFIAQTRLSRWSAAEGYRVASASNPNTEKTSGFRSRLYSAVSRAARLIFSHTSASRARRARFALAFASSARKRSLTQRSTLSMKDASATRSLPPSASPRAWSSRGRMADEKEERLMRRLLENLEQRIGRVGIEFIDRVDDADSPTLNGGGRTEERNRLPGLVNRDHRSHDALVVQCPLKREQAAMGACRHMARHRIGRINRECFGAPYL